MNCDETFNAGVCYITDAYKRVCKFNEELHADLEKYRAENAKLRELARDLYGDMWDSGEWLEPYEQRMCELGVEHG